MTLFFDFLPPSSHHPSSVVEAEDCVQRWMGEFPVMPPSRRLPCFLFVQSLRLPAPPIRTIPNTMYKSILLHNTATSNHNFTMTCLVSGAVRHSADMTYYWPLSSHCGLQLSFCTHQIMSLSSFVIFICPDWCKNTCLFIYLFLESTKCRPLDQTS